MIQRGFLADSTMTAVVAAAAVAFDVPVDDLTGPRRHHPLVTYRHTTMLAARQLGNTFPQIARAFGSRDHSTVMNACRRAEADPVLAEKAALLAEAIRNEQRSLF